MIELDLKKVRLIALYTGNKGYGHCVCKCPCCSQRGLSGNYQGNLEQIEELLNKFVNLEQLYFFGNPDPAVDTNFCNAAAKLAISRGIKVCFSTSGVGGISMLQKLLNDIDPIDVDYISFSIDSIEPSRMSMLKGINFPWNSVIEGIEWSINNGYNVKIQPTLWSSNYLEAYSIIEYFALKGVKKYSFHIGSVEKNTIETHCHLTSEQIKNVHYQIEEAVNKYNVTANCPIIYPSCGENNLHKWYCMNPLECYNWLAFLKPDGVYATHVPIASEFDSKYCFNISETILVNEFERMGYCPFSDNTAKTKTLCRYITKNWN